VIGSNSNISFKIKEKQFGENFRFDRTCSGNSTLDYMDNTPYQKLLTPVHHIIGLILTFLVFVLMSILLVPFTFSTNALIAQAKLAWLQPQSLLYSGSHTTCSWWYCSTKKSRKS